MIEGLCYTTDMDTGEVRTEMTPEQEVAEALKQTQRSLQDLYNMSRCDV